MPLKEGARPLRRPNGPWVPAQLDDLNTPAKMEAGELPPTWNANEQSTAEWLAKLPTFMDIFLQIASDTVPPEQPDDGSGAVAFGVLQLPRYVRLNQQDYDVFQAVRSGGSVHFTTNQSAPDSEPPSYVPSTPPAPDMCSLEPASPPPSPPNPTNPDD